MTNAELRAAHWQGNFRNAFWRGHAARSDEKSRNTCPYKDIRSCLGHVTFSRAYQRAWLEGWDVAPSPAREEPYDER